MDQQNVDEIYFSYFGSADPGYYGIKYYNLGFISSIDRPHTATELPNKEKALFAISATNLQATYYPDKNIFAWLKNFTPSTIVGNSIFVYDITTSSEAHRQIGNIFVILGDEVRAKTEYQRADEILKSGNK